MSSVSFPATSLMWNALAQEFTNAPYPIEPNDTCVAKTIKVAADLAKKLMIATAAVVALVVTPFFMIYDSCCGPAQAQTTSTSQPALSSIQPGTTSTSQPDFLEFYLGNCANQEGDTLEQIHQFDDRMLEARHNYIQYIFITNQRSNAHPRAPTSTPEIRQAFRDNPQLEANLIQSLQVMLRFWGFQMDEQTHRITRADDFAAKSANWLRNGNHNFLRIDRVINSLCQLGKPEYAREFFVALEDLYLDQADSQPILRNSLINHWRPSIVRHNPDFIPRV